MLDPYEVRGLLVRLHILKGRGGTETATGRAFAWWITAPPDTEQVAFEMVYSYDSYHSASTEPIMITRLYLGPTEWRTRVGLWVERHPEWNSLEELLCTAASSLDGPRRRIPSTHPLALAHLARMHAAISLTLGEDPDYELELEIASKRLARIIRDQVDSVTRVFEFS
ncbi:MAG TPA: hypothetical protein VLF41_02185 [Candidatus Nanoarchaeia archaeon]|nr:hypothetical protein [Candidatus Nanoarchaeia archaeon]